MSQDYLELFDFLESYDASSLFAQREEGFQRIPFSMELTLYRFIYNGAPQEMKVFFRKLLMDMPNMKLTVGKTSGNQLRQMRYAAVAAVALACRAAIMGGLPEPEAYGKSDEVIMEMDNADSIRAIVQLELRALLEYAVMVQEAKSASSFSPVVRRSIDYISEHIHQPISLEELAGGTGYTKGYLARLFKAQVGISVTDYILRARINEAKALLRQGKSCAEVSHLLGFSSQSYFTRQFRALEGMTPKRYSAMYMPEKGGSLR